jgi:regulator of protease activity HflC (stomatin/prohibitin superfamily)
MISLEEVEMSLSSYSWIIVLAIIVLISVKVSREDERFVIFRLGRFSKIAGPGLFLLIPFVDRGIKVNLSENIPGWQGLSKEQLDEKIKNFVLSKFQV